MTTPRTRPWLVGVTALGLAAAAATTSLTATAAETMTRVSEGTGGVQANGFSGPAVISGDGRYVAFTSTASNLTANDTDTRADVFVRDRVAGTTELVSVGTAGIAGGGTVDDISADGRFVVFTSSAADLVANDFNGVSDVFLRDRVLGTTERVSVTDDERQAQQASTDGSVTRDGRSVTFSTMAPLGVGDADFSSQDVYVRDRTAGTTELVSVTRKGAAGGGKQPTITDGGRFISFTSRSKALVKDDRNKQEDVFVRDLQKNRTERVSVGSKGEEAGKRSFESQIAGQGRYVVFTSAAGNLVKNDRNRKIDVFVHDRNRDKTQIASVDNSGKTAGGPSVSASISADGRYVLFSSAANLRRGGGTDALYLRDRSTARTTPIVSGVGTGAVISGSGHEISLLASRANVVPGDTNGVTDVFVYTW